MQTYTQVIDSPTWTTSRVPSSRSWSLTYITTFQLLMLEAAWYRMPSRLWRCGVPNSSNTSSSSPPWVAPGAHIDRL